MLSLIQLAELQTNCAMRVAISLACVREKATAAHNLDRSKPVSKKKNLSGAQHV